MYEFIKITLLLSTLILIFMYMIGKIKSYYICDVHLMPYYILTKFVISQFFSNCFKNKRKSRTCLNTKVNILNYPR